MDVHYQLMGTDYIWDDAKAAINPGNHDKITFEEAATVFCDPYIQTVDAEQNGQARLGGIGYSSRNRMLFVVHCEENDCIRIITAWLATSKERKIYDDF